MIYIPTYCLKITNNCKYFILECVIPSAPANGSLDVLSNGNVIKYYCDIGYTLNGSLERQCGEDGSGWNGNEPSCGKCLLIIYII